MTARVLRDFGNKKLERLKHEWESAESETRLNMLERKLVRDISACKEPMDLEKFLLEAEHSIYTLILMGQGTRAKRILKFLSAELERKGLTRDAAAMKWVSGNMGDARKQLAALRDQGAF